MLGWMRGAFFVFLGSISYSLYLLHQAIGFALIHELERRGVPSLAACLSTLVVVVALASALTFMVERPVMRKIRSWWRANSLQLKSA